MLLVVICLALICVTVAIWRPVPAFALLICLVVFNSLISSFIDDATSGLVFGATKDAMLAILFIKSLSNTNRVPTPLFVIPALILILASASALQTPLAVQAIYGLRNDYEPIVLAVAACCLLRAEGRNTLIRGLALAANAAAVVALVTWRIGIPWLYTIGVLPVTSGPFPTSFFTQGSSEPRAFSPAPGPNELGLVLAFAIVSVLASSEWGSARKALLIALPVFALLATQSRSAILGAALGCVVLLLWPAIKNRSSIAVAALVVVGVGATVGFSVYSSTRGQSEVDYSAAGHAASLREAFASLFNSLMGVGVGQVGPRAVIYSDKAIHVESFFLLIGLEAGVLVLGLLLALNIWAASRFARSGKLQGWQGLAIVATSLPSQILLPAMQDGSTSFVYWTLLGAAVAATASSNGIFPPSQRPDGVLAHNRY